MEGVTAAGAASGEAFVPPHPAMLSAAARAAGWIDDRMPEA
jgi:hypothetical protein